MVHTPLKIGTRKSKLALIQTDLFKHRFAKVHPEYGRDSFELVPQETSGDKHATERLADIGGKGLFTKELDLALLDGSIDLAVHSLKDVETILPPGIKIACVLEREDPRDALITEGHTKLADLKNGAIIGTASLRRQSQILHQRPDLSIQLIRGNIPTRLKKLDVENFDGTFLALSGLKRLGMEGVITDILDPEVFVPAAGQGALAVCIRDDNSALDSLLAPLNHAETDLCVRTERALLKELDASCHTPIGAHATLDQETLTLRGFLGTADGTHVVYHTAQGSDPILLGKEVGNTLKKLFLPHKIHDPSCFS